MRPTRDLHSLQRAGLSRTGRLHAYASSVLRQGKASTPATVDSAVAFVVIELDNLWAGVARSFFLSVAFRAQDGSGNRLVLSRTTTAQSTDEALTHAIRSFRGPTYKAGSNGPWTWRDEPPWWKPHTLLDALQEIGASNYQQVSAAMSASPGAFSHLHTFRNFYAHRNQGTRAGVVNNLRRLQFPTAYTASRALTSPAMSGGTTRPQPLLLDWLDDIRNTIALLV